LGNRIEELADAFERLMMKQGNFMEELHRSAKGELFVLKYLQEKETPVTPTELSEALHSSTSRISAVLGKLQQKNHICREIDPSNRRNILVILTEAGRERAEDTQRQLRGHLLAVLEEMGEQDASELIRLIMRFFEIAHRNAPHEAFCCDRPPNR
jgi:DNA-binding MarR family transcriptional regulator